MTTDSNNKKTKDKKMAALTVLGYMCYVFAVIDFCGMFGGYDLTGTPISPVIAGVIGSILIHFGKSCNDDDDDEDDDED